MYHPSLAELKKAGGQGKLAAIYREIVADLETPVSAYLKIKRGGYGFLLESVEGGERLARYSFIGAEPYRLLCSRGEDGVDPLNLIAEEMKRHEVLPAPGLPRFAGGAVGYLAYEAASRFEELPRPPADPLGLPEACFMFCRTLLVYDHISHTIKVVSHVPLDGDIDAAYAEATSRIDELVARLRQPLPAETTRVSHAAGGEPVSNFSRAEFEECVLKIKEYIAAGEAIQVVLSQRFTIHPG